MRCNGSAEGSGLGAGVPGVLGSPRGSHLGVEGLGEGLSVCLFLSITLGCLVPLTFTGRQTDRVLIAQDATCLKPGTHWEGLLFLFL